MGTCCAEERRTRNNSLTITPRPTMSTCKCLRETMMRETLGDIFDKYDVNGNGYLEKKEIIEMLKETMKRKNKENKPNLEVYADRMLRFGGD